MSLDRNRTDKRYIALTLATTLGVAAVFGVMAACTDQQAKAKINIVNKDPVTPGVIAKIDGKDITLDQLTANAKLEYYELKKHEYEFILGLVTQNTIDTYVAKEAKAANMSVPDYTSKKLASGIKVSDSDYKKFVAERHFPEAQITPQIKEKITEYLKGSKQTEVVQEHVAKVTKGDPIYFYMQKPTPPRVNVDPGNGPHFGGDSAKVTIVEFSDFQCPYCSRAAETVNQVKKKYGNKIRLVFRQFPLPMHPNARPAAEAALCVNEQGNDKFWKFHDLAFKNQEKLDAANLVKYAKDSGADPKKFSDCVSAHKFSEAVQKDMAYGESLNVKSTPTFFINGQIVNGAVPLENFSEIIDEELK